ncbi:hypothetical protein SS50377_27327 [Spironucleus salmonicida]|uniref:RRM domain-containing protein n=1 Tax=Spironucleus salmonicida TaxID=348837 RepID=V6LFU2_9EUKA|nr:hypothetical protein SS50377_27327 [Spironucleus salmonicida]|eukprot:EST43372.1 Hypothetical protein SS50377_17052 [Spironucleus salmonicida]
MDFLKKFQVQSKLKEDEEQKREIQNLQIQNPYHDFPDSPRHIYKKLTELCKITELEEDNTEFTGFKTLQEDFIITADDKRSVRVIGVARNATATDLQQKFCTVGDIKKISQGGGGWIIEFVDESLVAMAIERISGQMLLGQKLKVELKKTLLKKK